MGWRIQLAFFAAAALAHAGSISGSGLYVDVHSAVASGGSGDAVTYSGSFILIIEGGSGNGFFEPLAQVRNTWSDSDVSTAAIQITCGTGCGGSIHTDYSYNTSYSWYGKGGMLPFSFGVPISLEITLTASNFGGIGLTSDASIGGFALVDPGMNRLVPGGVFNVQGASVPEPGSIWLSVPAVLYGLMARRGPRLKV